MEIGPNLFFGRFKCFWEAVDDVYGLEAHLCYLADKFDVVSWVLE